MVPNRRHIELDEDPDQALYREIQEETGLKVEILATKPSDKSPETKFMLTPSFVNVHEANPPHKHITLVYFARQRTIITFCQPNILICSG